MERRGIRVVATLGLLVSLLLVSSAPALAVPGISTDYPAVDVAAGEQVDFGPDISGTPGERIAIAVAQAPDGWDTRLRAGGFNVRAVAPDDDGTVTVTLDVTVPADAPEGTHEVTVEASSSQGVDTLTFDLNVTEATSALSLDTEFAALQGDAEDTFSFRVELANDIPDETTFALSAVGPEGWQVSANPTTEERANTVTVEAGGTATIAVEATPPPSATAGEYPIRLEVAGGGQSAQIDLVAHVTGTPQLGVSAVDERLNASGTAGRPATVTLVVANEGSSPLTGVEVSADAPIDWETSFVPAVVETIQPGDSAEVVATITPSSEAVVGDYVVTFTVSAESRQDDLEVRFSVETSPGWGIAALVVIALVIAGLVVVFRRYGRR